MSGVLPGGALEVLSEQLHHISAQGTPELGLKSIGGVLIALWSANSGIKSLFDSLNQVYDETESRSFLKLNAISLAFTISAILFIIVALAAMVALPVIL